MASAYVTASMYERASTGLDTSQLLGIVGHLASDVQAGATTLALGQNGESFPTTLEVNDQITLFDCGMSEQVRVTGAVSVDDIETSTVPITPLQYSHTAGIEYCTDGDKGSLADMLIRASRRIDAKCNQTLCYGVYTERIPLQTMSASINVRGELTVRPSHHPILSVASLALNTVGANQLSVDVTQVNIEYGRVVTLSTLNPQVGLDQGNLYLWGQPLNERMQGDVLLNYAAGYTYDTMPADLQEVCILYASVAIGRASNPLGVAGTQAGKQRIDYFLRGDQSGQSAIEKEAEIILLSGNYIMNAW